jgi:hypothetical protein
VIDDFELVQGGIVAAEYLAGKVTHVSETGQVVSTAKGFSSPPVLPIASATPHGTG